MVLSDMVDFDENLAFCGGGDGNIFDLSSLAFSGNKRTHCGHGESSKSFGSTCCNHQLTLRLAVEICVHRVYVQ